MKNVTQAIIIAAGRASRMNHLSVKLPKCLTEIAGKTILDWEILALKKAGITKINLVRGYAGHHIKVPGIHYFKNNDWPNNNILASLFFAEQAIKAGGFIFSYSDILYSEDIINKLLTCPGDIVLVIDQNWRSHYRGRDQHPITEAELVKTTGKKIIQIGKGINQTKDAVEFIGLAKFSAIGSQIFRKEYHRLKNIYQNKPDAPFQKAAKFKKAYLTDMIQELIDRNYSVDYCPITSPWSEVDTPQDYQKARQQWQNGKNASF